MKNSKNELQRITAILLKPEDDFGELAPAVHDLYRLLVNVSGLETATENPTTEPGAAG